jgi:TRAP-type C4-dicarboxylate transport system substrate-binding protein
MSRLRTTTLSVAVLAAVAMTAPVKAQEVTLRLHSYLPPVSNPAKTFLIPWSERIFKASNGRLKVQDYWSMQLGGTSAQLIDQIRDGVVDIGWTLPGFTPGRMPRVEPFELPFVHKDALSSTLALQDYQEKYLLNTDLKDFHPILLHVQDGFLFQTKTPVLKMEDLKGMKIRAASRAGVWFLEALGASGVGLPLTDIPPALSKGVIDGVLLPYEIAPAVKMQDLVSNFSVLAGPQPRVGTSVFTFLMNKQSYAKLPPDLKKVIDDNSGRNIARWAGENWRQIEIPGKKVMESKPKNKFYTIPPAEVEKMRKAAQPVFDHYYAEMKKLGIDGEALVADARAMIDKYSQ